MTTADPAPPGRDELVDRLFMGTVAALELFGVYLGQRLGLYEALADHGGGMTADELAHAAGIAPRYAREWLEQQAVAAVLAVSDEEEGERRFALPAEHREVVADADNLAYVAPFALLVAGIGQALPQVLDAYRSGGGVPWTAYGADARDGQAAINRPAFLQDMGAWISSMPDVDARLQSEPPARVGDVGCGTGWSTAGLARAFPRAEVTGFDVDEASISEARANGVRLGVGDRLTFAVHDAANPLPGGPYELICIFEALHDMPRPVEALAGARAALAPGGSVLVVDERVADAFSAPGDPVERMMYGWSILCCLPTAMVEVPSAATGTVMRADVLRRYAGEAGFRAVEVLPVDNDLFRFYRLRN